MKTIKTMTDLRQYLDGILFRAEHHSNCDKVVGALIGEIMMYSDTSKDIEVRTYDGKTANVAWVYFSGVRYAFCFNHKNGKIELRDRNERGRASYAFDNYCTVEEVHDIIKGLV